MAACVKEVLPPSLDSTSEPPVLFDGTTRLYVSYICPYAQRAWIARNYKGLQDKIKLVPINLSNRPAWYKEKVYARNKVPALEHNNEVKGESLDLLKYIDSHFEGPSLLPSDPTKQQFAEELLAYSDEFNKIIFTALPSKGGVGDEAVAAFDKIEGALSKFDDGPFFLGQFSLVDVAYIPFFERFQAAFLDVKNYDITKGRPKLAQWIEHCEPEVYQYPPALLPLELLSCGISLRATTLAEINKIDAYSQTQVDPQLLLSNLKKHFGIA